MATLSYEDFQVLQLKFSPSHQSCHHLFFKPHSVRVEEPLKPRDRTLFCANIPPWATVDTLRRIFQPNGPVEQVYLQSAPSVGPPGLPGDSVFREEGDPYRVGGGFKFGYIVFERPQGVKNAMNKMDLSKVVVASTVENPIVVGVKRWAMEYNEQWRKEEEVKESIENFMVEYDKTVAEEKKAEEDMGEPDEDGWVTVTRQDKKKPPAAAVVKEAEDRARGKKNRRKKKKLVLQNFYSHQVKEDKMDRIQDLRKKFEEDKLKIAKMKSERKFRPF
eukprot:GFUD01013809.1.p1 GENE.GFUD01013809.1~~GFUD01013809.1.p1  ORF type:complete len:275 (+),score=107.29 GFUD01013809.1:39-863(+)